MSPIFASQFNAHVENVTAIAKRIPTSAVSYHICSHFLQEMAHSPDAPNSDHLKMINAVYSVLPDNLAADGIAAALLSLLEKKSDNSLNVEVSNKSSLVRRLLLIMRSLSKELGATFDCRRLLSALRSNKARPSTWTVTDEEDKARLMFQCVILLVDKSLQSSNQRKPHLPQPAVQQADTPFENAEVMKKDLIKARKVLLDWGCNDYAPLCSNKKDGEYSGKHHKQDLSMVGAGAPDYSSMLDGLESSKSSPRWLETMRCVLFLEQPESPCLHRFLFPGGDSPSSDADWKNETLLIARCCEYGADVDDEMVSIVLKAGNGETGMSAPMALTVLEHAFHGCSKSRKASLHITDAALLDELYTLVEYLPPAPAETKDEKSSAEINGDGNHEEKAPNGSKKNVTAR